MSLIKKDKIGEDLEFKWLRFGPITIWRDSFTFKLTDKIFWNLNFSWPGIGTDNIIVPGSMGPGRRLEFTLWPLPHVLIALDSRSRAMVWTFREGYRHKPRKWGYVSVSPPKWMMCKNLTGEVNRKGEMTAICGAFRWHKCPYASTMAGHDRTTDSIS